MQKEVRDWFGAKYDRLTDAGIDGFWNDMNEPAIFYSTKGLEKRLIKQNHLRAKTSTFQNSLTSKILFSVFPTAPRITQASII